MATTIKIKHSTTAGNAPSSLAQGELAINVADGNLFYGDGTGVSQDFAVNTITAQQYIVSSSVTYMTQSFSSGSTAFGDSTDDTHVFTGGVTATEITSSTFNIGDGAAFSINLTNPLQDRLLISSAHDGDTIGIFDQGSISGGRLTIGQLVANNSIDLNGTLDIDGDPGAAGALVDINNTRNGGLTGDTYGLKVKGGDTIWMGGPAYRAFGGHFTAGGTSNAPDYHDSIALYAQADGYNSQGGPFSYAAIFSGSNGIVGINTMEPTVELDVVGSISASSNVVANAFYGDGSNLSFSSITATAITASNVSASGDLTVNSITAAGTVSANKIESAQLVSHLDDPNTGLQFGSDTVVIEGNNTVIAKFTSTFIELNKETKLILEESSLTDGDGNGDVVKFGSVSGGGSLDTGKIYYLNSSGQWAKADADSTTDSTGLLGVALGTSVSSDGLLIKGMVTLDHDPGSVGDQIFLKESGGSSSDEGKATSTAPSSANNVVRHIGYCLHSTAGKIYFDPSPDYIVHS